jgi:hypothetical protein
MDAVCRFAIAVTLTMTAGTTRMKKAVVRIVLSSEEKKNKQQMIYFHKQTDALISQNKQMVDFTHKGFEHLRL